MQQPEKKYQNIILFFLILVAMFFWNTIIIYPIKLFVVMLHEMSHGLMAIVLGGKINKIQIDQQIGGYCEFAIEPGFFNTFMTSSAGYLGSLFWGSLILILAFKTAKDKYITLVIGFVLLWLSYYVFKSGEVFGTTMTSGLGVFMLIAFKFFGATFHDLWLKFIGIITCAYVILDIKDDLIARTNIGSDADAIAKLTGIPSLVVGVIWLAIALLTLFFVLRYIYRQKRLSSPY